MFAVLFLLLRHSLPSWKGFPVPAVPLCVCPVSSKQMQLPQLQCWISLEFTSIRIPPSWAQPSSHRHRALCGLLLAWRKLKSLLCFSTLFRWKYTFSSSRDVPRLEPSCPPCYKDPSVLLLGSQGSRRTHNNRTHGWSKASHTLPPLSAAISILFLCMILDVIKILVDNPDLKDSYTFKTYLQWRLLHGNYLS